MRTVVVQAHPLEDSYNAALLDALLGNLSDPTVVRLAQGDPLTPEALTDATTMVAVYPTWWGSPPAILLDALNSLIGPWVDGPQSATTSPLRSVIALMAVTTHGSSRFVNRLQGEPGLQLWKRTVLPLCATEATFDWRALYKLDRATTSDRKQFLRQVQMKIVQAD